MGVSYHLAVLLPPYLDAVCRGEKKMECRLTRLRGLPHGRIKMGDHVWLKESSGPIRAHALAGEVLAYEHLTSQRIQELREEFGHLIMGSDEFWGRRRQCRFMTLIPLEQVRAVRPIQINKSDRRPWALLSARQHRWLISQLSGEAAKRRRNGLWPGKEGLLW